MFTEQLAKIILVPYLWFGGYAMDEESIAECNICIEIQCSEEEKMNVFYIPFVSTPD